MFSDLECVAFGAVTLLLVDVAKARVSARENSLLWLTWLLSPPYCLPQDSAHPKAHHVQPGPGEGVAIQEQQQSESRSLCSLARLESVAGLHYRAVSITWAPVNHEQTLGRMGVCRMRRVVWETLDFSVPWWDPAVLPTLVSCDFRCKGPMVGITVVQRQAVPLLTSALDVRVSD